MSAHRPRHEESCEFLRFPDRSEYWTCDCRMRGGEVETGCHGESLEECRVCLAVSRSLDSHLDWHLERGDFA